MALSGKYDFQGIKKFGAKALSLALSSTAWGAWLIASPFKLVVDAFAEQLANWLANRGLIIINVGAIIVEGEIDQKKFDSAMEEGLAKLKIPGISDAEKAKIDQKVIDAIRKLGRITDHN